MILEVEQRVDVIREAISTGLVTAAVQNPEDEIVTWVGASDADGDLVGIDGVIDIDVLARLIEEVLR